MIRSAFLRRSFAAFLAAVALLLGVRAGADDQRIRVAAWNLNNLHDVVGEPLRSRAPARSEEDYAILRRYADKLAADIIAFQEVNGEKAAGMVFDPATDDIFVSGRRARDLQTGAPADSIYTGFAVRKGVFDRVHAQDYEALSVTVPGDDPRPTRWGVDLQVERGGHQLRLLAVHLRSGCFAKSLEPPATDACKALAMQRRPLENWVDARSAENVPFIVLGDFNRAFDIHGDRDHIWQEIDDGQPPPLDLVHLPDGMISTCWEGTPNHHDHPIDFVVLDEQAADLVVDGSLLQLDYAPPIATWNVRRPRINAPWASTLGSSPCRVSLAAGNMRQGS